MYNPFPIFTPGLLDDQLAKGKRWFIRQTFPRGMEARLIAAFLIRGYDDDEKATADQHLAAIKNDGNAYLYDVQISGHSTDGVLVQDGASAKVLSSTIDAASSSGRSARVRAQSILWFDEEQNGPTARSVLHGPVCVTGNSYVDTNNSSTKVNTQQMCGS